MNKSKTEKEIWKEFLDKEKAQYSNIEMRLDETIIAAMRAFASQSPATGAGVWRSVSDLPKEQGWYLLKTTECLPNAVGRVFFDGEKFMFQDTPSRYAQNKCPLLWLDESGAASIPSTNDESFENYMRDTRIVFVSTINHYFPAESPKDFEGNIDIKRIRVEAENLLICFDQMRDKLQGAPAPFREAELREALARLINKYQSYFKNIQWHIETNKPEGDVLQTCQKELSDYGDIINDLQSLSSLPSDKGEQQKDEKIKELLLINQRLANEIIELRKRDGVIIVKSVEQTEP